MYLMEANDGMKRIWDECGSFDVLRVVILISALSSRIDIRIPIYGDLDNGLQDSCQRQPQIKSGNHPQCPDSSRYDT